MKQVPKVHFIHKYLLNPTNPVILNLIGAGGTGSQMLTALSRINQSLLALGHPGFMVRLFDDDIVSEPNLGRQLFASTELGLNKAVALINRVNRFFGTNWKAIPAKYSRPHLRKMPEHKLASLTISCVDNVASRFDIEQLLTKTAQNCKNERDMPLYWCDLGNSRYSGQVVIATVGEIAQPNMKKYEAVSVLPFITQEFKSLLQQADDENQGPSCSLAEALQKQDLFINSTLANLGASLLWNMFREGMLYNRGFFLNLKDFRAQPLKVS